MSNILAPQPDGYPCSQPDYSKPLPGEITHWTGPARPVSSIPPASPAADPWDKRELASPCKNKSPLPPVQVFNGTNPRPRYF